MFSSSNYYQIESRYNKVQEEEVYGWIRVQGTNIDIPIVDSYIEDISDRTGNFAWMNPTEEESKLYDRTIVYGHNLLNLSATPEVTNPDHTRFEQLLSFLNYNFAKENQYIQYSDDEKDYLFEIYSVSFYEAGNFNNSLEFTSEEKEAYINKAIEDSIYNYNIIPSNDEELITLSTCTRFFGPTLQYQFRIEGRIITEKNQKKEITKTENYEIIDEKVENKDVISNEV